jgi:sulfate permease, SulP family
VLVTVFVLTLLVDLTVGIGVGVVLASLLFVRRMAATTEIRALGVEASAEELLPRGMVPKDVEIYEIAGPFFFGAADQFKDVLAEVSRKPRLLIVRMRHVPIVDSTGLNVLRDLIRRTQKDGTRVMLVELRDQPRSAIEHGGLVELLGQDGIRDTLEEGLSAGASVR